MSPARALRLLGEGVALVLALAASLGLFDALRSLPGTSARAGVAAARDRAR